MTLFQEPASLVRWTFILRCLYIFTLRQFGTLPRACLWNAGMFFENCHRAALACRCVCILYVPTHHLYESNSDKSEVRWPIMCCCLFLDTPPRMRLLWRGGWLVTDWRVILLSLNSYTVPLNTYETIYYANEFTYSAFFGQDPTDLNCYLE